jgi:Domain of unknown function (DUF4129)
MRPALRSPRAAPVLALAALGLLAIVALASNGALHGSLGSGHTSRGLQARTREHFRPPPAGSRGGGGSIALPGWLLWAGLGVVALAVLVLVAVLVRGRRLSGMRALVVAGPAQGSATAIVPDEARAQAELREIVDRSLEDLRADPNARRAIIGAYHLMERALERAGLPRAPAEAPREYLARALAALQVGPEAPRRLTALFERARFGGVELELGVRDEAIDALLELRGDLDR